MSKNYPKGSEWRKWDLHVHTPESVLNNGFGANWDEYVRQLFTRALVHDITSIGVTDYFTIEGYKKLKTQYLIDAKLKELGFSEEQIEKIHQILILPNIEFRLDKLVQDNRVNFHVIFSDEVAVADIEENFLRELRFAYEGNPQAQEEMRALTLHNLSALGERLQNEHEHFRQHPNHLYTGMMNAVVSDEKISEVLTSKPSLFKGKYLIATPSDEDLSAVQWNGQGHNTRKVLIQKSDCLFASNPNTRKWALGKFNESAQVYIDEFKSLKPCIWGSDAHIFDEMFVKNADRLCWIKADPSFEGLKQIIYEPEERVSISERKPDEKNVYDVIEKVKFLDSKFQNDYININENLTSIIGGKSTGKSILIKSIARTADVAEFNKRNKTAGIIDARPVKGFEVVWKDGQVSKLGSDDNPAKKIIYIPQSYLNRVVDKSEEDSDIDKIIQDVLLQKDEFKEWFGSLDDKQNAVKNDIEKNIKLILDNFTINITKNKEKKAIGDVEGVKKQIEKLEKEIKDLQDKSSISEDDRLKFNTAIEQIKTKRALVANLEADLLQLEKLKSVSFNFDEAALENLNRLNLKDDIRQLIKTKSTTYLQDWQSALEERVKTLKEEKLAAVKAIDTIEAGIKNIRSSLKGQDVLNALLKEKEKEEAKIIAIEELNKLVGNSYTQIQTGIENLADLNAQFYLLFLKAKSTLNLTEMNQELSFDIQTNFKSEKFQETYVEKFFDSRTTRGKDYEYLTGYNFTNVENHKTFIKKELWKIVDNKLPKLEHFKKRDLISSLVSNWFKIDYKVSYQNDDINDMSPGKKSFVLLRLLIDLDDSTSPILIDQPEDDLDNRSIYNQVVKFLRKRKKTRQIIIVTHNPNLVLGADAELIVVANQDGEGTENKSYQFEYISGSIENTRAEDDAIKEVLYKRGVQEHICDVLEGGPEAFDKRKKKYNF